MYPFSVPTLTIQAALAVALVSAVQVASAADDSVGKAKVQQICSQCHQAQDWQDDNEAQLRGKIKDVVAGKVDHPQKLTLTDAEIASIAAYWKSAAR
jgi:mono/diheme cytochrome c family protein